MRRIVVCIIGCLFMLAGLQAADMLQKTLPNGMRVVVKVNRENTSTAFYCHVHTGSENEGPYLGCGLSHYLEHVVSGGSTQFHSEAEYQEMEKRIGAIVNAYTVGDETAFYIQADNQYQDQALKMLAEHVTACAFDSSEVAREKEVIVKEIVMRSTPPDARAYQRYLELAYPNSPKGLPIIGYPEMFRTVTREQLMDYYHAKYMPNNVVFVACGNFNPDSMMVSIEKTFADWPRGTIRYTDTIAQNPYQNEQVVTEQFGIEQSMTLVNVIIPSSEFQNSLALDTACGVLFGSRQAPIRYQLVEKKHWCSFIYMGTDTSVSSPDGSLQLIFDVQPGATSAQIIAYIDEQIAHYVKHGFKQKDIDKIVRRIRSHRLLDTPDSDNEANRLGSSMLQYNVPDIQAVQVEQYATLQPIDLANALQKFWLPKHRLVFNAVPIDTTTVADTMFTAKKVDPRLVKVDDKLTLLYRENREKPIVRGVIWFPMTREYATPDDMPQLDVMFDLLNDGSKHFPSLELSDWMEQHSASSNVRFGNFGCMLTFRCLKEDFPQMKKILSDALTAPTFSDTELKNEQQAIMSNFYRSMSDAGSQHDEFIRTNLFPGQREGLSRIETAQMQLHVTADTLRALYKRYVVADSMIVTLFGDLSESEARKAAQDFRHVMPKATLPGAPVPTQIAIVDTTYTEQYRFEETNIDLITAAPGIRDADFPVMTVITSLLSGSHGRLFNATRGGTRDLAYYAFADYNSYYTNGYFQVTSQTSLPKADTLMAVLRAQLTDLCNTPVSQEELASAVSENHKIILNLFTDNLTPLTTTNYQAMGLGFDYLYHSNDILNKVTPADVQRVARKYFSHITGFVSKPQPQLQRYGE